MIVSRGQRVLFVHVHRTGGSSISTLLRQRLPGAATLGGQHAPLTEGSRLLGEDLRNYFKFAFVRNPWERILSWWMVLKQAHQAPGSAGSRVPESLEAYVLMCHEAMTRGGPLPFPAEQMALLSEPSGPVLVDDLGRYERYEEDVRRIFRRLDITLEELPRAAATNHDPYQTYYTANARRLVCELYPRDTRELGYDF